MESEKMKLNVTDAECLDFLSDMGPSTAGDLAKITRLTTGAITNAIDRLEKAGFVERKHDVNDRRKVIVKIIEKKKNVPTKVIILLRRKRKKPAKITQSLPMMFSNFWITILWRSWNFCTGTRNR